MTSYIATSYIAVKGDVGGRQVIMEHPDDILEVAVDSESVNIDIDTVDDYNLLRRKAGRLRRQSAKEGAYDV